MTTLTTRPLPLLPLAITPSPIRASTTVEPLCIDRSPVTSLIGSPPIINSSIHHITQNHHNNQIVVSEEMHPDNLLLQGHGVTSPRLSSTNSTNNNNNNNIDNRDQHPLGMYNNSNNNNNLNKIPNNINCDLTSPTRPILGTFLSIDSSQKSIDNNHRNSSSENDSEMSFQLNSKSSFDDINPLLNPIIKINNNNNNNNNIIDDIDDDDDDDDVDDDLDETNNDRMSCCSEDSELSVGQEGGCDNNNIKNINSEQNNNYNNNNNNNSKKLINNNRKFVLENNNNDFLNNEIKINRHQQQIMMLDDSESVDNMSSVSDIDNNRCGGIASSVSVISENLPSNDDDLSNDSTNNRDQQQHLVDPSTIMMATAAAAVATCNGLRIPSSSSVPSIVRPSPTRIQEEFLRKSHLYAEELMKQQMQFMAAARASAFSLRHGVSAAAAAGVLNSQDIAGKVGFRPHIKQQNSGILSPANIQQQQQQQQALNENLTNFSGIHSHLNAISKLSSQLGGGSFGMAVSASVREQSQSPPSQQHLNNNHHHHMHQLHPHLPFLNNNFHEPSLKFSIDNILKADFGRRITDPLLKRNGGLNSRKHTSKSERLQQQQQKNQTAIDLTNLISHTNNSLHQISSGLSSVSSNCSSDSNSTINTLDKNQRLTPIKSPSITSPSVPNVTSISSSAQSPNSAATATTTTTGASSSATTSSESSSSTSGGPMVWPAWVYCTRYSDRPSSGRSPRTKKPKKPPSEKGSSTSSTDDKRPRTAFSGPQLARLKHEFAENRYLTEKRRQQLSGELGLNEAQIKIWFQNKRAKIKKSSGSKNPLALQLMAQGLYNHSTVPLTREEEELQELQAQNAAASA